MIYVHIWVCVSTRILYVASQHRSVSGVSAYCRSVPGVSASAFGVSADRSVCGVSAWVCIWCLSTSMYVVSQHKFVCGVSALVCMWCLDQHKFVSVVSAQVCIACVSARVCSWFLSTGLQLVSQHESVSVVITSLRDVMTAIKPAAVRTCHSVSCACAQNAKIHDHTVYKFVSFSCML